MRFSLKYFFLHVVSVYIFSCILSFSCVAQKGKKIELRNANSLEFDDRIGNKAKRLIGNVVLEQGNMVMYCDSAYLYDNNTFDAYNNVHITQGASVHLYGSFLKYDGNTQKAELQKNVRMIDGDVSLTTEQLFYDMENKTSYYVTGGKLVNKETTLTSDRGYYFSGTREFFFKRNVILKNPEYTMLCDTLKYRKDNKTVYFYGPTSITGKDNFIYCENGWFDTGKDISKFSKNAYIISKDQKLVGDSIFYDRKNNIGRAFGNVQVIDTTQNIVIQGNFVQNSNNNKNLLVTGNALLIQIQDNDSLFLHADTLKAEHEDPNDSTGLTRILYAFNKVKFFKSDMQGKCDSLVYKYKDSTMYLYQKPILWSGENQLSAEEMRILTNSGKLFNLKLIRSAFIVSREDSIKFNQIKGKEMKGHFTNNQLTSIKVEGNGQTIYYAKDNDKYIGVNRAECSDLLIKINADKVQSVMFYTLPDATLFPMNELNPKELILKDFFWDPDNRPITKNDIFTWK